MSIKMYQVGGCVRDAFLGRKPKDIDYAIAGCNYEEMVEFIKVKRFSILTETPQHFTLKAKSNSNEVVDFVLCRQDIGSVNGRYPEKVMKGTIEDDLSRRDLTINAIAKDMETGEIIDPHNGQFDIERKLLRSVGDPVKRLTEDGIRILRVLRFSIEINFMISQTIWNAFHLINSDVLSGTSTDRKREELTKMFSIDSLKSMELIVQLPERLRSAIFADPTLWLMPTQKVR